MTPSELLAVLESATLEELAAIRAKLLGPNVSLDDDGNLSVAGNLSADGATWAGTGVQIRPITIAELNHLSGAIQLVTDALNPVAGEPVVAGGTEARLVRLDGGAFRVIGER